MQTKSLYIARFLACNTIAIEQNVCFVSIMGIKVQRCDKRRKQAEIVTIDHISTKKKIATNKSFMAKLFHCVINDAVNRIMLCTKIIAFETGCHAKCVKRILMLLIASLKYLTLYTCR